MADKNLYTKDSIESKKEELITIIKNKDINAFVGGAYISDLVTDLRLSGVQINLPYSFTCATSYNYFEVCAEIVRQIDEYLHPCRTWFKNHIEILVSGGMSLIAIIISIVSLF